jgi:hypothetical protein
MNPKIIKEDLSSGLKCDTPVMRFQNGHIRELIEGHKDTIVIFLGGGKT